MRKPVLLLLIALSSKVFGQSDSVGQRKAITTFFEQQAGVHYIYQAAISPDGRSVLWTADEKEGPVIHLSGLSGKDSVVKISACPKGANCNENEPQWSPNGNRIAFLSNGQSPGQLQVFIAQPKTNDPTATSSISHFDGHISHLKWSPDGKHVSVLYIEKPSREPSPMAAVNRKVGLIDSLANRDVQCVAVIDIATGEARKITPEGLYIFEYDWSPDSKNMVYTAAPPPGDDNWYIARIYRQSANEQDSVELYKPLRQVALPKWSPDGKSIAFVEGLMSDQGGTGGEILLISSIEKSEPMNLTPHRQSTPSWFTWTTDQNILFTEFVGGSVAINNLHVKDKAIKRLWMADESIRAGNEETSISLSTATKKPVYAFIRTSWERLPEVHAGPLERLKQITQLNTGLTHAARKAQNLQWINEGKNVQGWLLYPDHYDPEKKYPMLVYVHGGPAWIASPTWSIADYNATVYTQLGYFIFCPNPRGSFGQGEEFTLANRRDWGFGDLRDILAGIDTILNRFSVDSSRLGILGWSYGGSMAMFAITQTNRFKASVAGAGACDWKSYYGQNSIDKWMGSYFGASPYDDPVAYDKCSSITYIKKAKTPTMVLVGELDGEAPAPQSFQFWHALKELNIPTQLIVYPEEGHSFEKFDNMIDVSARTLFWFEKYLKQL